MGNENTLLIKINGDEQGYQDALKAAGKETEALQGKLNSIAKAGAIAFAGFGASILFAAKAAGKFETIETQFEVLTGSVTKAKETIKDLSDFSAKTPFKFEQVAQAGKQMLGFQVKAEDLTTTLQKIGDVSAATGARFGELSLIFGQVKAAGKLTGERLLQLQERAIPIGPALAKTMGVAETAIKDMVSKGKVSFETFETAFASLSAEGGLAFQGMEKNSKTLEGQLSTMGDNFDLVTAQVGKNFLPVLKMATAAFTNMLEFIREHPGLTSFIAKMLVAGTVTAGIVTTVSILAIGFLKLRAALIASTIATRGLSFAVKGLIGATGLGLLIAFLPEILSLFRSVFTGAKNIVQQAGGAISKAVGSLGMILKGLFTFDLSAIKQGLNDFKDSFAIVAAATAAEFRKSTDVVGEMKKQTAQHFSDMEKEVVEVSKKTTVAVNAEADKRVKKEQEKNSKIAAEREKRIQGLLSEQEVLRAHLEGMESEEIAFLERRQAIKDQKRDAEATKDEEEQALMFENILLKNEMLLEEEALYYEQRDELRAEQAEKEAEVAAELEMLTKAKRDALQKEELQFLQNSFITKEKMRSLAAKNEIVQKRKEKAIFLADEVKFGTAVATFRSFMRTSDVKNAANVANVLVKLQNSKNAKMKAIGKAAAMVQIGIETAKGAISAYSSLSGITYVGPILGALAAAAVIAYGAERLQDVQGAQQGGLVAGTGLTDSIPFMLTPDELVTPKQNFEEVVSAVADQRASQREDDETFPALGDEEEQTMRLDIGFDGDEAADVLTVRQNEESFLGTSQAIA